MGRWSIGLKLTMNGVYLFFPELLGGGVPPEALELSFYIVLIKIRSAVNTACL